MLRGEAIGTSPLSPRAVPAHRASPRAARYELGVLFTFSPASFPNAL